jgi:mannose-6-phosphate isomerase-like protein (cupin superfamily)
MDKYDLSLPDWGFTLDEHIFVKTWGRERVVDSNARYAGKILEVTVPGQACSIHYHKLKTETFYVLKGRLVLEIFDRVAVTAPTPVPLQVNRKFIFCLHPKENIHLNPGIPHRFWMADAAEPVEVFEFSSPDSPEDSYRIEPAGPAPNVLPEQWGRMYEVLWTVKIDQEAMHGEIRLFAMSYYPAVELAIERCKPYLRGDLMYRVILVEHRTGTEFDITDKVKERFAS